jgi:hypothetical protein
VGNAADANTKVKVSMLIRGAKVRPYQQWFGFVSSKNDFRGKTNPATQQNRVRSFVKLLHAI